MQFQFTLFLNAPVGSGRLAVSVERVRELCGQRSAEDLSGIAMEQILHGGRLCTIVAVRRRTYANPANRHPCAHPSSTVSAVSTIHGHGYSKRRFLVSLTV